MKKIKAVITAAWSTLINALLGVGKLCLGLITMSPWLIINAVYYLVLCCAEGTALWRYAAVCSDTQPNGPQRHTKEYAACKHGGIFLCLLGFSYLLISIRMFFREETTLYPDYVVYVVVLMTLAKFAMGVYGMFVGRGLRSPLVLLMRIYSFADACVSVVLMRCALLLVAHAPLAVQNSAIFGMIVSVIFMVLGTAIIFCRSGHKSK